MDTIPNFAKYLENANSGDQKLRDESYNFIRQCKGENPTKFITTLVKELCDGSNSENVCQMGALAFKNTLINATREQGMDNIWVGLDATLKSQIKEALFSLLASDSRANMKNAGLCLAIIAAIEVPSGQWPEFLQSMQENSQQTVYNFRLAAVQTLGFMTEFLEEVCRNQNDALTQEQIGQILFSTISNLAHPEVELQLIAIQSLLRTIPSTGPCFQIDDQRSYIMDGIFKATESCNTDVVEYAIQCLTEIPSIGYECLDQYIQQIGELTLKLLNNPDLHTAARLALLFWTNLCRIEHEAEIQGRQSKRLIASCYESLLSIVFQGLEVHEMDEADIELWDREDDQAWTVLRAAGQLLSDITFIVKSAIWEASISHAITKLASNSWLDQYIGLTIIGSVVEGTDSALIAQTLDSYVDGLFQFMQNTNGKIRYATVWVIMLLCKNAPQVIVTGTGSNARLNTLIETGMTHIKQDHASIKLYFAQAWHHMFVNTKNAGQAQIMNNYFQGVMETLIQGMKDEERVQNGDTLGITDSICEVILNCDEITLRGQLYQLMTRILEDIGNIYANPQLAYPQANAEQRELFLDNYCSPIQVLMIQAGGDIISDDTIGKSVQLVDFVFEQAGRVSAGGLFILNGLIHAVGSKIYNYMSEFMNYICHGISGQNTDDLGCRLSAGMVSDLANAVGEGLAAYLPQIVQALMNVLENANMQTESKLVAIEAMGSLCLVSEKQFQQYLPQVMNSFYNASICSLSNSQDEDQNATLVKLRAALVEGYLSILHGMHEDDTSYYGLKGNSQVETYANQMFQYLEALVADKTCAYSSELLKQMFELYIDIVQIFVPSQDQLSRQPFSDLAQTILASSLGQEMECGLGAVGDEDRVEITQRFNDTIGSIHSARQAANGVMQIPTAAM